MKTENLRVNQLGEDAYRWYRDYLAAMDDRDVDRYGAFLAEDCELTFNNEAATVGKSAVLERLRGYWKSFAALEHDLLNIYGADHRFMLEALNAYTRLDGAVVTCRAAALTDRNAEGQVTSVRLYTDVSPVFT